MSLPAIPEGNPCRFDGKRSECSDSHQDTVDQVALSIKHTFIEIVAAPEQLQRVRSYTDSDIAASSSATTLADDKEVIRELSDEASTDVASDAEAPSDSALSPSMPVDWASPCWGPAGDLFYSHVANDEFLLPASEMTSELALDDGYSWSMMADEASWGLTPEEQFAWGVQCSIASSSAIEMQTDQWQAYGGMDCWYDHQHDLANAEACMESFSSGIVEASMAACMFADDCAVNVANISAATSAMTSSSARHGSEVAKTTIMLRNLPSHYKRSDLIEILEDEGFEGSYDLVYVPMDFTCQCCLGYAFANFLSDSDAARCWTIFDGFSEWGDGVNTLCEVMWSHPHQGVEALIERYRNSPVMHDSVPDEWKPAYFVDGVRAAFPEPTEKLKAPKQKARSTKAKK